MNTNNTKETGVEEATGTNQWTRRFLTAGTELGLGDLSMMVGVVSEILQAHTRTHHQELQKARQDWLREEMVKLKDRQLGWLGKEEDGSDRHPNYDELQTIIDRYQSELDQPITNDKTNGL